MDARSQDLKKKIAIKDISGITKSLMVGQKNFIVHFAFLPDQEYFADKRENIIEIV